MDREKIFVNHMYDEGLISRTGQELTQLNSKQNKTKKLILMFLFFVLRKSEHERWRGREGQRIRGGICTDSSEPKGGARAHEP